MSKTLSLLFLLSSFSFLIAQETIIVSGQLFDSETKETLPFANVAVHTFEDNTLVTGAITDIDGRFEIQELSEGKYVIYFSFIGYSGTQQTLLAGGLNTVFDLGKVGLAPSLEALDEVEVTGTEATTNSDLNKKSFNLDNNIAQSGGSVLDAMKTMPGVTFDQEGKVILRGSDKVVVLIDGKQSSLTGFGNQKGLGNIPASNIDKIEIINNPSAKYDANGFAGIINIVYKKEKQSGFNGDVGLSFGLGALGKRKPDTKSDLGSFSINPKLIPSINLNYKQDKINYFLQSEFILQEALPNNEFTTRNYDDGRNIISQVPENRKQFRSIINGGFDYDPDENNSFTFSGLYDREKHIDTAQVAFIDLDTDTRNRIYNWQEEEVTRYINATVNYRHKFQQAGHTLSANAQYTQGLEDETYSLNDSSSVRIGRDKTNIRAIENTTSVSVDYVRPLKNGRVELGTKLRIRRLPVDYTITPGNNSIIYPDLGTFSDWGENLYAGYVNYLLEKEKYDVEAGLRAEQTDVFYDLDPRNAYYPNNDEYDYFEFFPSVRVTYKLNDRNKISAFYNRRIDRPGEPELRIFPKYDDPELLKVGNPYLRPQFTDAFELAHKYSWGTGSLFSALYHRIIQDQYMRIFAIDDSNPDYDIVNRIYQNTGSATNTGIELLLSQDISNSFKLSATVNYYVNAIDAYQGMLLFPFERPFIISESSDEAWDAKLTSEFKLPWEVSAQLTGVYYSERNIPQGEQLGRSSVDFGLKRNIWDNKGELTLAAADIFNTFGIRQEVEGQGFIALYENYYETQIIRAGLKYRF
ncbi:vitamin B12/cobalamin outer membrane transporter [Arenibacter sp. NBRC 103722]|uniref:TonB-dependent receptor domain-containing protein n=1 Tax=Arenibacter sp. NBRC 103722 TaxID=1113929 RepID=UPI0008534C90|nr:TonB-dependent receptor [Arenibacter sp. NBRC 103722]MDX1766422.1 TonB-dependent receptor [Arenibacter troitsensis]GBF21576.1 vitamin B12/cobalamin outer membrane transporter [Arenibacter sp. NBRC 103722]HCO83009.1 TonB-dependent receptor [Arenibacter sp.]|tara:strand:- start:14286 stop:16703 length:2418 start_codon:yes stop_codon:yes gene_type:complete